MTAPPNYAATQTIVAALTQAAQKKYAATQTVAAALTQAALSMPVFQSTYIGNIDATMFHPETTCNWSGVGGTIEDADGNPFVGITVRLGGTLGGEVMSSVSMSGSAPVYGKSGFEFTLGDSPLLSANTLWIRLFDSAGLSLSDEIYFNTSSSCEENLVLVRFKETRE